MRRDVREARRKSIFRTGEDEERNATECKLSFAICFLARGGGAYAKHYAGRRGRGKAREEFWEALFVGVGPLREDGKPGVFEER